MPGLNSNSKLYLLLVSVELDTFSILPPLVLGGIRSTPLPMPTTLVGALMRAVLTSSIEPAPEAVFEEAGKAGILYASFRPAPYAVITTIEDGITLSYQKRERFRALKDATQCLDILIGRMNFGFKLPKGKKEVVEKAMKNIEELIGHEVSKECMKVLEAIENLFGPLARTITGFGDISHIAYIVTNPNLAVHAWGIHRIGRKEDLAVVRNVSITPINNLRLLGEDQLREMITTRFYIPAGLAVERPVGSVSYKMRVFINGSVRDEWVYTPPPLTPGNKGLDMKVMVNTREAVALEVSTSEFRDYLILPREVIEHGQGQA